jgi:hypothetical protein
METITKHAQEAPVPPSRRTPAPIPDAYEQVILACLEKDPDRRPVNGAALLEQLSGLLVGRQWTPSMAREWWKAHPASDDPSNTPAVAARS